MQRMPVTVRSFAKINLGLSIGPLRADGFHELRTVYQTIALHDVISVSVGRGSGIEVRCEDARVPRDESNTCYRIVERAMSALKARGRVVIEIEKRLPVQGGLGGASGNAVASLLALERALKKQLSGAEKLRIAAEVGSDLPLFLVGGTVLGVGRGEEVYPLPDLPSVACVVATPEVGISTPKAFAGWDAMLNSIPQGLKPFSSGEPDGAAEAVPFPNMDSENARGMREGNNKREGHDFSRAVAAANQIQGSAELRSAGPGRRPSPTQAQLLPAKLTPSSPSDRMIELGRRVCSGLSSQRDRTAGRGLSGVSAKLGRGRAENPLLDLVRTGIENDFERVVFPQYPELREVKRALERAGAFYASLSGSGSAMYGLFASRAAAEKAVARLGKSGVSAVATTTLTRQQYWRQIFD